MTAGSPSRALELDGVSFPDDESLEAFLRGIDKALAPDDEIVLAVERATMDAHRTHVVVTTCKLIIVQTDTKAAPRVLVWDRPKALDVQAYADGEASVLMLHDDEQAYAIRNLPPFAAHRVKDMIRVMRIGRMHQKSPVPDELVFEGIYPIEWYEAAFGPNQRRELDSQRFGDHRYVLEAAIGTNHGCFQIRHFLHTHGQEREVHGEGWTPFRSNQGGFMRDDGLQPYVVRILPATMQPLEAVLAKNHITQVPGAKTVRERYRIVAQKSALEGVVQALEAGGIRSGEGWNRYRIVRGEAFDYLRINTRTLMFDKQGRRVECRPVHQEPSHAR